MTKLLTKINFAFHKMHREGGMKKGEATDLIANLLDCVIRYNTTLQLIFILFIIVIRIQVYL